MLTFTHSVVASWSYSGAGLGGLVLSLLLQKNCHDLFFTIYEAAHKLAEVGAGIGMWPRV